MKIVLKPAERIEVIWHDGLPTGLLIYSDGRLCVVDIDGTATFSARAEALRALGVEPREERG